MCTCVCVCVWGGGGEREREREREREVFKISAVELFCFFLCVLHIRSHFNKSLWQTIVVFFLPNRSMTTAVHRQRDGTREQTARVIGIVSSLRTVESKGSAKEREIKIC